MWLGLLALLLSGSPPPAPREVVLERVGTIGHPPIQEASGLVKSRRYPGVFWTHNDSGHPATLFAVRRDGSLVREYPVGALNVDWEDVAADGRGHLFLGDIGNNGGRLPLRAIYQVDEPDPAAEARSPLPVRSATFYKFPPGGRFDAEGLAVDGDRALLVAKTFDGRPAEVYTVPLRPPAPMTRPAVPERAGSLDGFTRPVTGASLSPDGRRLAVCSLEAVGVYSRGPDAAWVPVALRTFRSDDQIEAVAWDGDDLILAGEGRGVYRLPASAWEPATASSPRAERHAKP
jgi:hypothetical protein